MPMRIIRYYVSKSQTDIVTAKAGVTKWTRGQGEFSPLVKWSMTEFGQDTVQDSQTFIT